jgi:hypothetical protein
MGEIKVMAFLVNRPPAKYANSDRAADTPGETRNPNRASERRSPVALFLPRGTARTTPLDEFSPVHAGFLFLSNHTVRIACVSSARGRHMHDPVTTRAVRSKVPRADLRR